MEGGGAHLAELAVLADAVGAVHLDGLIDDGEGGARCRDLRARGSAPSLPKPGPMDDASLEAEIPLGPPRDVRRTGPHGPPCDFRRNLVVLEERSPWSPL